MREEFQVPVAFIILKEYRAVDGADGINAELKAHSKEKLPKGYRPVRYEIVDKIPLTKVGKVNYLELEKIAGK